MEMDKEENTASSKDDPVPLILECVEEELSPTQIAAYSENDCHYVKVVEKVEAFAMKNNERKFSVILGHQSQQVQPQPTPLDTVPVSGPPIVNSAPVLTYQGVQGISGLVCAPSVFQGLKDASPFQLLVNRQMGLLIPSAPPPDLIRPIRPSVQIDQMPPVNILSTLVIQSPLATPQLVQRPVRPVESVSRQEVVQRPVRTVVPVPIPHVIQIPDTPVVSEQLRNKVKIVPLTDKGANSTDNPKKLNRSVTYPSLTVVARAYIRSKFLVESERGCDISFLNSKMKHLLRLDAQKFTEWLFKEKLIPYTQYCRFHGKGKLPYAKITIKPEKQSTTPCGLSLFPLNGGYVLSSQCCPNKIFNVLDRTIFEGSQHPPITIMTLLYHWCCNTNVHNITQWCKVDISYVKLIFSHLRAVCIAANHECFPKLGGLNKFVEIGLISLGTTSANSSNRQVKVEILGVYDRESKFIRLRAIPPLMDSERNLQTTFTKILEPIEEWIDKRSKIVIDYTVDKTTLINMGFKTVYQMQSGGIYCENENMTDASNTNANIMEYLRTNIPEMLQKVLSLLSNNLIQQFLDEIVWREKWGYLPSKAFDALIYHISAQTQAAVDAEESLLSCWCEIARHPFRNWKYNNWKDSLSIKDDDGDYSSIPITDPIGIKKTDNDKIIECKEKVHGDSLATVAKSISKQISKEYQQNDLQMKERKKVYLASGLSSCTTYSARGEQRITLRSFYYGTLYGNKSVTEIKRQLPDIVDCIHCRKKVHSNCEFLKHILSHTINNNWWNNKGQLTECFAQQCQYCLKPFYDKSGLTRHIRQRHKMSASATDLNIFRKVFVCLICLEKFDDRTIFIFHMHETHRELELPFHCAICGFRTSEHYVVVDHFYNLHINDGISMQCPLCLEIVKFPSSTKKIRRNLYFFHNHVIKHFLKSSVKCRKCCLNFHSVEKLSEHEERDHCSFKNSPGIVRYFAADNDAIVMPKPVHDRREFQKNEVSVLLDEDIVTDNEFNNIKVLLDCDLLKCSECENTISDKHFSGAYSCSKCSFSSCCKVASRQHNLLSHSPSNWPYFFGECVELETAMHCVCGFYSISGHKLANHLAKCHKKTAYPTAEIAANNMVHRQSNNASGLLYDKVLFKTENLSNFNPKKSTKNKSRRRL